ncbi:LOW QUALITY PROTEIN: hypothetical protein U9M48_012755, partial [Paspalum notatum var. saurae]
MYMLLYSGSSIGIGAGSGIGVILLVLIQLVAKREDIAERMIIALEEIEKATNSFDKAHQRWRAWYRVQRDFNLLDLHVIAIKKSKIAIQREIDEFINEVAILSQISHKNVLKLFGCCLKTEVPLLVYEFLVHFLEKRKGKLGKTHLHVTEPRSLSWNDRLRIMMETTKVSIPIIHRDVKSANIFLDDTLTSKVSDFGASRHIPVDRTGAITKVQGTIRRLTEKSDVYSFGVLVIELLTRKKPTSYVSSEEEGLVAHFIRLLASGRLFHILDWQVTEEGGKEVEEVAALAATCVKLNPDERPTMRRLEIALEGIQAKARVSDNVTAEKLEGDNTRSRIEEACRSRRYSLEEEFLLSARFP